MRTGRRRDGAADSSTGFVEPTPGRGDKDDDGPLTRERSRTGRSQGRPLTAAVELLGRVHAYVRKGWCQGADATDASGEPVEPWSAEAARWSLLGAVVAALDRPESPGHELPLTALAVALGALADLIYEPSLARWNDDPLRSQQEVLTVLERARMICLSRGHDRVEPEPLP
jgi:hypothetical protein